jgi:uncharacterized protein YjbJ (UPF0337 family)
MTKVKASCMNSRGEFHQQAGKLNNSHDLQAEGLDEKLGGKIQNKVDQTEKVLEK